MCVYIYILYISLQIHTYTYIYTYIYIHVGMGEECYVDETQPMVIVAKREVIIIVLRIFHFYYFIIFTIITIIIISLRLRLRNIFFEKKEPLSRRINKVSPGDNQTASQKSACNYRFSGLVLYYINQRTFTT